MTVFRISWAFPNCRDFPHEWQVAWRLFAEIAQHTVAAICAKISRARRKKKKKNMLAKQSRIRASGFSELIYLLTGERMLLAAR